MDRLNLTPAARDNLLNDDELLARTYCEADERMHRAWVLAQLGPDPDADSSQQDQDERPPDYVVPPKRR